MPEQHLNIVTRRDVAIPQYVCDKFPGLEIVFHGYHYDNYTCCLNCSIDDSQIVALDRAMQEKRIVHYATDSYAAE